MITYTINEPLWDGNKVGIAAHRVKLDDMIEIKISYRDRHGNLIHPHLYIMDCKEVRKYPIQVRKGVKLHLVPIEDFRAARRQDDPARKT